MYTMKLDHIYPHLPLYMPLLIATSEIRSQTYFLFSSLTVIKDIIPSHFFFYKEKKIKFNFFIYWEKSTKKSMFS